MGEACSGNPDVYDVHSMAPCSSVGGVPSTVTCRAGVNKYSILRNLYAPNDLSCAGSPVSTVVVEKDYECRKEAKAVGQRGGLPGGSYVKTLCSNVLPARLYSSAHPHFSATTYSDSKCATPPFVRVRVLNKCNPIYSPSTGLVHHHQRIVLLDNTGGVRVKAQRFSVSDSKCQQAVVGQDTITYYVANPGSPLACHADGLNEGFYYSTAAYNIMISPSSLPTAAPTPNPSAPSFMPSPSPTAAPTMYRVTRGLVMSLDAASYTGSGIWTDSVAGRVFTLYGSPLPVYTAANGGSIGFTPISGNFGRCTQALPAMSTWTIEVWIYNYGVTAGPQGNTFSNGACIVTDNNGPNGRLNYFLGSGGPDPYVATRVGSLIGSWFGTSTGVNLPTYTWSHLVGTYDGSTFKLYLNNVLQTSTAGTVVGATDNIGIHIMRRWDWEDAYANLWGGRLGIVRIYNVALTGAEISVNWLADGPRFGFTVAPTAFPTQAPSYLANVPTPAPSSRPTLTYAVSIDILVVAGGGGGGNVNSNGRSSPGGAGGLIYISGFPISQGTYTVTVAAGGALDTQGGNSVFTGSGRTLTALGGGYGRNADYQGAGIAGGSGASAWFPGYVGGASTQPPVTNDGISLWPGTGYGNVGGNSGTAQPYGGGGGGAGGPGGNWNDPSPGPVGGIGMQFDISGAGTYYAGGGGTAGYLGQGNTRYAGGLGGGGRGDQTATSADRHGVANTGGGGGSGGTGGSGVVVLRYPDAYNDIISISPALTFSYSRAGGWKVYIFTAGSGPVGFYGVTAAPSPLPTFLPTPAPTPVPAFSFSPTASATGGIHDSSDGYTYTQVVFTSSGTFSTLADFSSSTVVYFLAVGGGGAGGGGDGGGGGGGGGFVQGRLYPSASDSLSITIGAGGTPIRGEGTASNGGNTVISSAASGISITAYGGGGGNANGYSQGNSVGASVGGGTRDAYSATSVAVTAAGTANQQAGNSNTITGIVQGYTGGVATTNAGWCRGGGGGGAGGVGEHGFGNGQTSGERGGSGGPGRQYTLNGMSSTFRGYYWGGGGACARGNIAGAANNGGIGGGGAGGCRDSGCPVGVAGGSALNSGGSFSSIGGSGGANTGGGGGGGGWTNWQTITGSGGSGIVVIMVRVSSPDPTVLPTPSPTVVPLIGPFYPTSTHPSGFLSSANNLLGSLTLPGQYVFSLDVLQRTEMDTAGCMSIAILTNQACCAAGSRLPAVYYCNGYRFFIDGLHTSGDPSFPSTAVPQFPVSTWVRLVCTMDFVNRVASCTGTSSSGTVLITGNNAMAGGFEGGFSDVQVYASNEGGYSNLYVRNLVVSTIATRAVSAAVSLWGGGGGGGVCGSVVGGGGGAASASISLDSLTTYSVVVGGGGRSVALSTNTGPSVLGGGGVSSAVGGSGQGGGLTGLFLGTTISQTSATIIAPGGGGSGYCDGVNNGGGGMQTGFGQNAGTAGTSTGSGLGGYTQGGATDGSALQGGTSGSTGDGGGGGGGGGGYWGGGAGWNGDNPVGNSGGGGGGGYYNPTRVGSDAALFAGSGQTPGNSASALRGSYGSGGNTNAQGEQGIFVLSVPSTAPPIYYTGTVAVTTVGANTIYTWTSAGTFWVPSQ